MMMLIVNALTLWGSFVVAGLLCTQTYGIFYRFFIFAALLVPDTTGAVQRRIN